MFSTLTASRRPLTAAACKIFRNTEEEKAFKEIEITFSLRHPHVIGLYAWFQIKGEVLGMAAVIESTICETDVNVLYRLNQER